tara:strand:+ start:347 stop:685 length:339 start_codon:yes stop_codon:yes gene_type:complete
VVELNKDKEGILHCWESTQLLRAWERPVQLEAMGKVKELFPNLPRAVVIEHATTTASVQLVLDAIDTTNTEDPRAANMGRAFTEVEDDEEWVGWVDWGDVRAQTAGAVGSSS